MSTANLLTNYTEIIYPNIPDHLQNQYTNVLLIYKSVPEYQTFVDSVNANTFPIVVSSASPSAELLGILRSYFTSIPRIGFCFASTLDIPPLFIDNESMFINNETMPYSNNVQLVVSMIQEFSIKNIDFLACDTLNYSNWKNYYDILRQSTGVIVGASDNKTGNIKYGGDWILESTSQDIETVYFTKSIEYYQYLLDAWLSVTNPRGINNGILAYNNYIYIGSYYSGSIVRVDLSKNVLTNWAPYSNDVYGQSCFAVCNGYLYGMVPNQSSMTKTNLSTGGISSYSPPGYSLSAAKSVCSYNNDLFISDTNNHRIIRANTITNTSTVFVSTGNNTSPTGLIAYNNNLYVSLSNSSRMCRYNITNPSDCSLNFKINGQSLYVNGDNNAISLLDNYMYIRSASNSSSVAKVNLDDLTDFNLSIVSGLTTNLSITVVKSTNSVYAAEYNGISIYSLPPPPTDPQNILELDISNTYTVSSGNLKVTIVDPYNVSTNNVTYFYSLNDGPYTNSGISNNGPTQSVYVFFISPLISNIYKISVYAKNSANISIPVTGNVNVFTVPSRPNSYSASFSLDTGIQVSITDTNNIASNNIYYHYYTFRVGDTIPNQSGNISVYSNSYVPLTSASSTTTFYIPNLMRGDYNIYVAAVNSYGANIYTPAIPPINFICFKENSYILTIHGYKKIQHLKKGDLVKTLSHGFKPIYRTGKKDITHTPTLERSKNHLYKCSTSQYPDLFEDLVLTGCHSILVDNYEDEEQLAKSIVVNGRVYITEGKYRLPVCADYRASIYEKPGKYTVYHIALENDDYYMNYGIYANGLLVESTSKRFLDQFPIMET